MDTLYTTIHYYLVDHPLITDYEWKPNQTPGSSPSFLALTVLTYLALTLTLHHLTLPTPLPTPILRSITALHNMALTLLSLVMAVGSTLSTLHRNPPTWAICFPPNTPPRGPTFFWAHVFYFSKILEFIDTLLILLSGSRSRRLSFLHVYHHAVVVVMCYLWLSTSQSLFPVALVTNATVHVVMYSYYLLCGIGVRPWWKRLVTDLQIVQFVFSFLISGWMVYLHFTGPGCEGILGWCFNAVFNASLLALFVDFHRKSYDAKKKRQQQQQQQQQLGVGGRDRDDDDKDKKMT